MTPAQTEDLVDVIFGTRFEIREALEIAGIDCDPLVAEDELFSIGLEPCSSCGRWMPSDELDAGESEPYCIECASSE